MLLSLFVSAELFDQLDHRGCLFGVLWSGGIGILDTGGDKELVSLCVLRNQGFGVLCFEFIDFEKVIMVFLLQIRYLDLQGFSPHSQLLVPQAQARLLLLQPRQRLVEYVRLILIFPFLAPQQVGDQISNQEV